jgi:hypothetical protein
MVIPLKAAPSTETFTPNVNSPLCDLCAMLSPLRAFLARQPRLPPKALHAQRQFPLL